MDNRPRIPRRLSVGRTKGTPLYRSATRYIILPYARGQLLGSAYELLDTFMMTPIRQQLAPVNPSYLACRYPVLHGDMKSCDPFWQLVMPQLNPSGQWSGLRFLKYPEHSRWARLGYIL